MLGAAPTSPTTSQSTAPTIRPFNGLARLVAFLGLVAVAIVAVHTAINLGLKRVSTSTFGIWNGIVSGTINADVVINGSSRALAHYDPRIISSATGLKAYNIGLNGSQTDMQLARLKVYLQHNRKPRIVIQNLDAFSFQTSPGEVFDPGQYIPYLGEPALFAALSKVNPEIWKSKRLPLYGYAVEDLRFSWVVGAFRLLGINPREDHIQGYRPRSRPWTDDFERLRAANPKGIRFEIEAEGIRLMNELVEFCHERDIPLLLIYTPEYAEMQSMTSNRPEIFAQIEALRQRHGVDVWDYSGSSISTDKKWFENSQHLNQAGAEAFTHDVARRLVERGVKAN